MKKFFAILLVLALCMGTFPAAYAEGGQGTLQLTDEEILDRVKGGWVGQTNAANERMADGLSDGRDSPWRDKSSLLLSF